MRSIRLLYWGVLLLALLATGCASQGEKKFEHPIPRLYGAEDTQFARTMGALLGPDILDGNDEANVNYSDADFARRQSEIFHQDLTRSRQITFQEWKDRPLVEKFWEHAASLFGSQL